MPPCFFLVYVCVPAHVQSERDRLPPSPGLKEDGLGAKRRYMGHTGHVSKPEFAVHGCILIRGEREDVTVCPRDDSDISRVFVSPLITLFEPDISNLFRLESVRIGDKAGNLTTPFALRGSKRYFTDFSPLVSQYLYYVYMTGILQPTFFSPF